MPCSLCAWRDCISWCLRQLADWRWPRLFLFLSTLTTTPSTLAFSHSPAQSEGTVKREMASDACTRDDERNQMPPTSRSTTPSSSLLTSSKGSTSAGQQATGSQSAQRHPRLEPAILSPLSRLATLPPPAGGGFAARGPDRGVLFPPRCQLLHRFFSPFFSSSSSLNRVCLLASAHRPPPRPTPQSSFVHHWGSPDPVLYMP